MTQQALENTKAAVLRCPINLIFNFWFTFKGKLINNLYLIFSGNPINCAKKEAASDICSAPYTLPT